MNQGFVIESGRACLLDVPNIDTDIIIPQTELATIGRSGLGGGLFARWRYREWRTENPEFALNRVPNRDSRFLLAASNFGCGSSREHAVWALEDFGIRAVISPRFGEIFRTNCVRNGVLPAVVGEDDYALLAGLARDNGGGLDIRIDLGRCSISAGPVHVDFEIDAGDRHRLLNGIDEIEETLTHLEAIEAFSKGERTRRPWLHWTPWAESRDWRRKP